MAGLIATRPMAGVRRGMAEVEAQWAIQADTLA